MDTDECNDLPLWQKETLMDGKRAKLTAAKCIEFFQKDEEFTIISRRELEALKSAARRNRATHTESMKKLEG